MKSAAAIGFDYRPSWLVATGIVVVLALALVALAMCGLPLWSKFALAITACVYATLTARTFLRPPCRRLLWHQAGHWRVADAGDQEHVAELRNAFVLGGLVMLSFRVASIGALSIPLLPDNCDADTRRRLRVRLARTQVDENQNA